MCFDVNRNLILHFLIVSRSCDNAAFCASRIVDISAWVRVFVILAVCVCERVCVDTVASGRQCGQRRLKRFKNTNVTFSSNHKP